MAVGQRRCPRKHKAVPHVVHPAIACLGTYSGEMMAQVSIKLCACISLFMVVGKQKQGLGRRLIGWSACLASIVIQRWEVERQSREEYQVFLSLFA